MNNLRNICPEKEHWICKVLFVKNKRDKPEFNSECKAVIFEAISVSLSFQVMLGQRGCTHIFEAAVQQSVLGVSCLI